MNLNPPETASLEKTSARAFPPGPCPPAAESIAAIAAMPPRKAAHIRHLHDTRLLIAAIWPDCPPETPLDKIIARAVFARELADIIFDSATAALP